MQVMRACEAVLPPSVLRVLLVPLLIPLGLYDLRLLGKLKDGWRALKAEPPGRWVCFKEAVSFHLARFLNFWPDQLALPRWRQRFDFQGFELIQALHRAGQPTVLVCLHHGPIHVLRYLLRAGGLPCAMVVLESRAERSPVREWKDRLSPPEDTPNVFCRDELKEMRCFMARGGCLLVAADYDRGRMGEVPFGPTVIRVATGAFRLANSTGATVFPVTVRETKAWRFKIDAGAGVPADGDEQKLMAKVLGALSIKILATPELMHTQLADSLGEEARSKARSDTDLN